MRSSAAYAWQRGESGRVAGAQAYWTSTVRFVRSGRPPPAGLGSIAEQAVPISVSTGGISAKQASMRPSSNTSYWSIAFHAAAETRCVTDSHPAATVPRRTNDCGLAPRRNRAAMRRLAMSAMVIAQQSGGGMISGDCGCASSGSRCGRRSARRLWSSSSLSSRLVSLLLSRTDDSVGAIQHCRSEHFLLQHFFVEIFVAS